MGTRIQLEMDKRYMISLDEPISTILDSQIQALGILLSVNYGVQSQWKVLAGELGITNEEIMSLEGVPQSSGTSYGYEVLKIWRQRDKSTIRVLRRILEDMRRADGVDKLDECRLNKVNLVVVIKLLGNDEIQELPVGACPGRKPLIEVVRPVLKRRFASTATNITKITFNLQRGVSNKDWTSQSREFVGQQVTIEMSTVSSQQSRQTAPTNSMQRACAATPRQGLTWADDDLMCFGYAHEAAQPDADTSTEPVEYENDAETPEKLLTETSVQETQENAVDYQLSSIDEPPEISEAKLLDCYCDDSNLKPDERRTWAETLLAPHKRHSGVYVVRKSSERDNIQIAVSVTGHRGRIVHFGVFSTVHSNGQMFYGIFQDDFMAPSLAALLEHYRVSPLRTQGSESGIYLKKSIAKA